MFALRASKVRLTVRKREPVTSGSVNVCEARFEFSPEWDGLTRTATFRAGGESRSVLLDESGVCVVPWEVLTKPNVQLQAGVCGTRGGDIVLPTVWADLGTIHPGSAVGEKAGPTTPDLWQQELAGKGDELRYTEEGELGLYAGERLLSSAPVRGGGEGGTMDHRLLAHRNAEGQHPISAIDGLKAALATIPTPMTADQLRKILINGGQ